MRSPELVITEALHDQARPFGSLEEAAAIAVEALREAGYVLVTRPVWSEEPCIEGVFAWTQLRLDMRVGDRVLYAAHRFPEFRSSDAGDVKAYTKAHLARRMGDELMRELMPK